MNGRLGGNALGRGRSRHAKDLYDRYGVKMDKEEKPELNEKAPNVPPSPKKKSAKELIPKYMEDGVTPYCEVVLQRR